MTKKDLYAVLGVPREASQDDIRKAYRALARKLHPDVNKEPDAQSKFTEVQEAYDILSDDEKKAAYDRYGHAAFDPAGFGSGAAGKGPRSGTYRWSNVAQPGGSVQAEDLSDLSDLFDTFFGGRRSARAERGAAGPRHARRHAPEPTIRDLTIDFETAARGGTATLTIGGPSSRTIDVKIPQGVATGAKLRVPASATGDGDILLRVTVRPHPIWRRRGDPPSLDLEMDLPLSLTEAIFGAKVAVPTLDGKVDLTVPPGAGAGKALRLKGRGLEKAGADQRGDLFVLPRVIPPAPDDLTPQARKALQAMADTLASPRTGAEW